jgi:hypothetical protein
MLICFHRGLKYLSYVNSGDPLALARNRVLHAPVTSLTYGATRVTSRSRSGWTLNNVLLICCWTRLTLTSSNSASFSTLCTIHTDLSELSRTLRPKQSALDQSDYYLVDFEVILLFGQTELKAQICWKHKVRALFSLIHFLAHQLCWKGR